MHNEHSRFKVVSELQHRYQHHLAEFAYTHLALPSTVDNVEKAMDYVFDLFYPRVQPSVANVAALPAGGNTVGDQRIVQDDGDGKAAMYMWSKFDGQNTEQWNKVADIDWGVNSVVQALMDQTQYLYPRKFGITDYDPITELALTGDLAGQHLYGGDLENQNLILHANNGDDVGVHTGSIFLDDPMAPLADLAYDLGEAAKRFKIGYMGTLVVGTATMTITSNGSTGLITDTNGVISFDDENLITTGNVNGTTLTGTTSVVAGDVTISNGSIISSSGAISFGDENISTSGTLSSGVHTITDGTDTLILDSDMGGAGTQASIASSLGTINLNADHLVNVGNVTAGIGTFDSLVVDLTTYDANGLITSAGDYTINPASNIVLDSPVSILAHAVTGTAGGSVNADTLSTLGASALSINDNLITTATTEILFGDHLVPNAATVDLGKGAAGFRDLYMNSTASTIAENGGLSITMATLMSLRDITSGANVGDAIFWNGSKFVVSNPDAEIDHGELTGIADDDHTQYSLLAGRAGGQTLNGGTLTTQTMTIQGNVADGIGLIIGSSIDPNADGTIDLGASGAKYKDLHMSGQGIGFRAENATTAAINAAAVGAGSNGRLWQSSDDGFLYVDVGTAAKKVGHNTFNSVYNQTTILVAIDVSASIDDARNAIWQVMDSSNAEEVMGLKITKTATHVTVAADSALPAGNYRLMGIEV